MDNFEFPNNKPSHTQRQKRRDKRLSEELIECRRYAGGDVNKKLRQKGETKRRQQMDVFDFHPAHEPINLKNTTCFGDNLEPLERFLRSHVGRPWSAVYAELNRQLDRTTVSGNHVIQHLRQYLDEQRWGRIIPAADKRYRTQNDGVSNSFCIHPETGMLCILNPYAPLSEGPFPKNARFKKAKRSLKTQLRLGLKQKTKPQKKLPDVKTWFEQFIVEQAGNSNSFAWGEFLHKNVIFKVEETQITLNLNRMEWTSIQKPLWGIKYQTIPYYKLKGRLWVKSTRFEKPRQVIFESFWSGNFKKLLDWTEG